VDFEHGLNAAVRRLREVLNDNAGQPRFVETLPRRGYRFIAPVVNLSFQEAAQAEATAFMPVVDLEGASETTAAMATAAGNPETPATVSPRSGIPQQSVAQTLEGIGGRSLNRCSLS
jgi:DNA-binding winged helix-turn-helix (wHTH) protein